MIRFRENNYYRCDTRFFLFNSLQMLLSFYKRYSLAYRIVNSTYATACVLEYVYSSSTHIACFEFHVCVPCVCSCSGNMIP